MSGMLILVNGIPGTGKSTLARKLIPDLGIPGVLKDDLKEFYYDSLHTTDRESSQLVGRIVFENLYSLIENFLKADRQIVVECPMFAEWAGPRIGNILAQNNATIIEIYCQLPEQVRKQRVQDRTASGTRHSQHAAGDTTIERTAAELREIYAPLELGTVTKVETTVFGDDEYQQLLSTIKKEIQNDTSN